MLVVVVVKQRLSQVEHAGTGDSSVTEVKVLGRTTGAVVGNQTHPVVRWASWWNGTVWAVGVAAGFDSYSIHAGTLAVVPVVGKRHHLHYAASSSVHDGGLLAAVEDVSLNQTLNERVRRSQLGLASCWRSEDSSSVANRGVQGRNGAIDLKETTEKIGRVGRAEGNLQVSVAHHWVDYGNQAQLKGDRPDMPELEFAVQKTLVRDRGPYNPHEDLHRELGSAVVDQPVLGVKDQTVAAVSGTTARKSAAQRRATLHW